MAAATASSCLRRTYHCRKLTPRVYSPLLKNLKRLAVNYHASCVEPRPPLTKRSRTLRARTITIEAHIPTGADVFLRFQEGSGVILLETGGGESTDGVSGSTDDDDDDVEIDDEADEEDEDDVNDVDFAEDFCFSLTDDLSGSAL